MESRSPCLPIPAGVRFQVCLPTPMASGYMYVSPKALARYLPAYKRALLAAIPHADLSIQWDVRQEVLIFENYFPWRTPAYKTEIADELARLGRRLDFLHLPVPKDRSDTAYFAPLAGLKTPQDTTLYLCLIHHDDAAGAVMPAFGIATECGWGRTDSSRVPSLIASHRHAMQGQDHG